MTDQTGSARTPEPTPKITETMLDPVRWRSYSLLRGLGPHRAADLAPKVGVSEGVMLRHLRVMKEIGFVRAVPSDRVQERYRAWEGIPGGLRLDDEVGKEGYDDEMWRRWLRVFVHWQSFMLNEWAESEATWPMGWRQVALNYDRWLHLTQSELGEFEQELHALTERWYAKSTSPQRAGEPDRVPIYVVTNAIPVKP